MKMVISNVMPTHRGSIFLQISIVQDGHDDEEQSADQTHDHGNLAL